MQNLCEIFRCGEHTDSKGRKVNVTEKTLDEIVSNFETNNPDVPICIGHPQNSAPAYGWVNSVKRIGDKLYCDFKQVQSEFKEAVNKGLFKTRSISYDPRTNTLRHIAFLGAQAPAIKGMEQFCFGEGFDLESLITIPVEELAFSDNEGKEKTEMEQKKIDEIQAQFEEQILQKDEKILALQKVVEHFKNEMRNSEFSSVADEFVAKGNILPAQRENVINIMKACDESKKMFEFSEGEEKTALETFKEFVGSLKSLDFSENLIKKNVAGIEDKDVSSFSGSDYAREINILKEKSKQEGIVLTTEKALEIIKNGGIQ